MRVERHVQHYEVLTAFDGQTCNNSKIGRVEGIQTHDGDDKKLNRSPLPTSLVTLHDAAPAVPAASTRSQRRITFFDTTGAANDVAIPICMRVNRPRH